MLLNMNLIPYDGDEMPALRDAVKLETRISQLIVHLNETRAKHHEHRSLLNNDQHWDAIKDEHARTVRRDFHSHAWCSAYIGSKLAWWAGSSARDKLTLNLRSIHEYVTSGRFAGQRTLLNLAKTDWVVLREYQRYTASRIAIGTAVPLDGYGGDCLHALCQALPALRGDAFAWFKLVTADFGYQTFPPEAFFVIPSELISETFADQPLAAKLIELESAIGAARAVLMDSYKWYSPHTLGELNEPQYLKNYERAKTEQNRATMKGKQNDKRCGMVRLRIGAEGAAAACRAAAERIENAIAAIVPHLPDRLLEEGCRDPLIYPAVVSNCLAGKAWSRELGLYAGQLDELYAKTIDTSDPDGDVCENTLDALFKGEEALPEDFASSRYNWRLSRYPSLKYDD